MPTFNLDWLLGTQPPPDLTRCDVEGAEVEVFQNQSKTPTEIRPVVVCEVPSENSLMITSIFRQTGYLLYDGENSLVGANEIGQASWRTVAVLEERRAQYSLL